MSIISRSSEARTGLYIQDAIGITEDKVKGLEKEESSLKRDKNICISIRSKHKLMSGSHRMEHGCVLR